MRVFKNKVFAKWASKEGLSNLDLMIAVTEITEGLYDADLGGCILKKRIAAASRGKRGGLRTIVALKMEHRAVEAGVLFEVYYDE